MRIVPMLPRQLCIRGCALVRCRWHLALYFRSPASISLRSSSLVAPSIFQGCWVWVQPAHALGHTISTTFWLTSLLSSPFRSQGMRSVHKTSPQLIDFTLSSALGVRSPMAFDSTLSSLPLLVNVWASSWSVIPYFFSARVNHWWIAPIESMFNFIFLGI